MTKLVRLTASYQLQLPDQIDSQQDGRVSSFWLEGKPLLLQISSYIRVEGEQVTARRRLADRLAKTTGSSTDVHGSINTHAMDQAAAEVLDADGVSWLHAYLVWPHLAIYALISGPANEVRNEQSWARLALESLSLRVQ